VRNVAGHGTGDPAHPTRQDGSGTGGALGILFADGLSILAL